MRSIFSIVSFSVFFIIIIIIYFPFARSFCARIECTCIYARVCVCVSVCGWRSVLLDECTRNSIHWNPHISFWLSVYGAAGVCLSHKGTHSAYWSRVSSRCVGVQVCRNNKCPARGTHRTEFRERNSRSTIKQLGMEWFSVLFEIAVCEWFTKIDQTKNAASLHWSGFFDCVRQWISLFRWQEIGV